MKEKGRRSDAVDDLTKLVDSRLQTEAKALGEAITRFEVISKKLLQKYNKVICHMIAALEMDEPTVSYNELLFKNRM